MADPSPDGAGLVTFGEVHTGLLQNSSALAHDHVATVLDLVPGVRVRRSERPIAYAVSPDRLTGVDCRLPSASGRDTRCVGTVVSQAAITGGHVAQSSAYCRVVRPRDSRRVQWSHYLSRPGAVEIIGKADPADLARGFVATARPGTLNVGAIAERLLDQVQRSGLVDRRPPFRTVRTRLRWTLRPAGSGPAGVEFRIDSPTERTVEVRLDAQIPQVAALCADLALHDWLLTTLLAQLETGLTAPGTRAERVSRLSPAVDCLLHLWMPAARLDGSVREIWRDLEQRPGFSRQWKVCVDRIRDQVQLGALALLTPGQPAPNR